jgi:DNA mismatch endonuclease, patch repair protein
MARVRSKDSRAELELRRALHARGVRFRLHASDIFGRPDLVIRKYRLAVFVDGDFWHGNAWRLRGLASLEAQFPARTEWWAAKIRRNIERDEQVTTALESDGWRVVRLWESEVLRDPENAAARVAAAIPERSLTVQSRRHVQR